MTDLDRFRPFWRWYDDRRLIPTDPAAELTVAGCAVATDHGARLALVDHHISIDDFHDRLLGRITVAAGDLEPGLTELERIRAVADIVQAYDTQVTRAVTGRSTLTDTTGWFARRIRAAAAAREHIRTHLIELEQLGVDVDTLTAHTGSLTLVLSSLFASRARQVAATRAAA